MSTSLVDVGWATDIGARGENQDRCAVSPTWAIVSDGLGGHAGGATAAQLTVDSVVASLASSGGAFDGDVLERAVSDANDAVFAGRALDESVAGMCATLTLAVATAVSVEESAWLVGNVGDSPAWLVSTEGAARVTADQNLAAELLRAGTITPEMARQHPGRHVVTQAIGVRAHVTASVRAVVLQPGDTLIVASDGLAELPDDVVEILAGSQSAKQIAARLVRFALKEGSTDNVTTTILRHLL